jgi:RND family efflux transporter MFP subunit
LARIEKLAEMQNVPASDVDRARNSVQTLRERVRVEQVELDRSASILREQLADLRDRKARCFITSPMDGYLDQINCVNGEFISEGSIPFVVATKSMYLSGEINEEDVGQIAPKMKAAVRLYSYADKDLMAAVTQILPTANNQRYTVTLTLDETPPNMMSGMTGEMNIIAGKHENALIIPSSAVLGGRVLVVKDNVVEPRDVKVGFHNMERTEILDGLQVGEQVVIADQDLFRPGQRVHAIVRNLQP